MHVGLCPQAFRILPFLQGKQKHSEQASPELLEAATNCIRLRINEDEWRYLPLDIFDGHVMVRVASDGSLTLREGFFD